MQQALQQTCLSCGKPLDHNYKVIEYCLACHEKRIFAPPNPQWRSQGTKINSVYTQKQRRLFHNTFSGLQIGYYKNQNLIFFTLTTQYDQVGYYNKFTGLRVVACEEDRIFNERMKKNALLRAEKELNIDFQKWKKRISRKIQRTKFDLWFAQHYPNVDTYTKRGKKQYLEVKKHQTKHHNRMVPFYKLFEYKMCYHKVRTIEGGGVIHGLIRKDQSTPFLDEIFLQQQWQDIHGANEVRVEEIEKKTNYDNKLNRAMCAAFYICGNYYYQQPVARQSSSYNWIFHGSMKSWRKETPTLAPNPTKTEQIPISYIKEHRSIFLNEITYTLEKYTKTVKKPNVLWKRKGLIQTYMNSRKSLRTDSGYENALTEWIRLTRNPPPQTKQAKIHTHKWELLSVREEGFRRFTLFERCSGCGKKRERYKIYPLPQEPMATQTQLVEA